MISSSGSRGGTFKNTVPSSFVSKICPIKITCEQSISPLLSIASTISIGVPVPAVYWTISRPSGSQGTPHTLSNRAAISRSSSVNSPRQTRNISSGSGSSCIGRGSSGLSGHSSIQISTISRGSSSLGAKRTKPSSVVSSCSANARISPHRSEEIVAIISSNGKSAAAMNWTISRPSGSQGMPHTLSSILAISRSASVNSPRPTRNISSSSGVNGSSASPSSPTSESSNRDGKSMSIGGKPPIKPALPSKNRKKCISSPSRKK